ncbi:MAG: hypothetical protein QNK05_00850 [Myxococcota bacterium]|nr:hypothetical protein [Myxococcota bacterium]
METLVAELSPLCRQRDVELLSLVTASPELVLEPDALLDSLRRTALACLDAPDRGGALLLAVVASRRDVTLTLASDRPSFTWALCRAQRGSGASARVRNALRGLRDAAEAHRGSLELMLCKPTARLDLHLPIDPEATLRPLAHGS